MRKFDFTLIAFIVTVIVSLQANAGAAGAVALMQMWDKDKAKEPEKVLVSHHFQLYDCRIAEISPDIPVKAKELCRKKIADMRNKNNDHKSTR